MLTPDYSNLVCWRNIGKHSKYFRSIEGKTSYTFSSPDSNHCCVWSKSFHIA